MNDRDTFAAAALTGLLSRPQWMPDECVSEAYRIADAMLRERERVTEPMPKEKRAEVALTDDERSAIECAEADRNNLPNRLRAASHYTLMDSARTLVREAADEIERTLWRAKIQQNIIARLMAELEKR